MKDDSRWRWWGAWVVLLAASFAGCNSRLNCAELRLCEAQSVARGGSSGADNGVDGSAGAESAPESGVGGTSLGGGASEERILCGEDGQRCEGRPVVYVSPEGSDNLGLGTKKAPLRSLAFALRVARWGDQVIRACNTEGSFEESLALGENDVSLRIEGGFSCDGFVENDDQVRIVAATAEGHRIEKAANIMLSDLRLESPAARVVGTSSYGLFVSNSTGIVLDHVDVTSGSGARGADAEPHGVAAPDGPDGQDGYAQCAPRVAMSVASFVCPSGVEVYGGRAAEPGMIPIPATAGSEASGEQGRAGSSHGGATCSSESRGGDAISGSAWVKATGSAEPARVTEAGYRPGRLAGGFRGKDGGGGGGGGAGIGSGVDCQARGASGGGGGAGGCGGAVGRSGQGGGGSFAIVSYSSEVELRDVALTVGVGGDGGAGGEGQVGGNGGTAGAGGGSASHAIFKSAGCPGGAGAPGARGGPGPGGDGGPSIAIAYQGVAPITSNVVSIFPPLSSTPGSNGAGVPTPLETPRAGSKAALVSFP